MPPCHAPSEGTAPPRVVVFFEGDQIEDEDTREMLGEGRWRPAAHLATVATRFQADGDQHTATLL